MDDLTEVRQSPIQGNGLFAKRLIQKGTIWWVGQPGNVLLINQDQYLTLKNSICSLPIEGFEKTILIYSYFIACYDSLVFCLDNARFVNHSFTPNSGESPDRHPLVSMALRDILPGEEITEDYTSYDQCPWISFKEDFLCSEKKK